MHYLFVSLLFLLPSHLPQYVQISHDLFTNYGSFTCALKNKDWSSADKIFLYGNFSARNNRDTA